MYGKEFAAMEELFARHPNLLSTLADLQVALFSAYASEKQADRLYQQIIENLKQ